MKIFRFYNNLTGWVVFLIATTVYIITSEPTASFWDCGEYISTAYKLQVGHPPGAPLFQLLGRFFSLFAFGNTELIARMINTMSALLSGFTILFLFWTITAFARRITTRENVFSNTSIFIIIGSGMVGALAYTFSDSFWFSAAEGEVYATSSFFTAIVFWAILKWDEQADDQYSYRWILLIAFLMGLSIGVHLLNLLTIPAMTMVIYFRKFKTKPIGAIIAFVVSLLILSFIMYIIIPQIVTLLARTELLFVNTFGFPFNSGTLFFVIILFAIIISGLVYTYKPGKKTAAVAIIIYLILSVMILFASSSAWNFVFRLLMLTALGVVIYFGRMRLEILRMSLLSLSFILIGYSSFLVLVIRSSAGTPINENAPKDAISLLSYLNREQYGDWPVFYGAYFNAPLDAKEPYIDGKPYYARVDSSNRYEVVDERKLSVPNYDKRFYGFFPRMWSSQDNHISGYKSWTNFVGKPIKHTGMNGRTETIYKPTFIENLRFFFAYQLSHMYFRYFLWNFAGKQNDVQGHGGVLNGNWISGIPFIDKMRVGDQDHLPEYMEKNKGRNRFYMLPLLLGIIGLILQINRDSKGAVIIGLLFIFTGIAINIYLNPVPYQPRERDYAYAASFYAFAIWIGLGVIGIFNMLKKIIKKPLIPAFASILICLFAVPGIMAREGWDDHDRSGRYTARDIAANYLNSCAPNSILFTLGDNDTFPLWYVQEVEGIRTDVRVVNLSLLNTDWYIEQMKHKAYDSEPVPFSLTHDKYVQNKREFTLIYEDTTLVEKDTYVDLEALVRFASSDNPELMLETYRGFMNFIPTHNFMLMVDSLKVIQNGTVPATFRDSVLQVIPWYFNDYGFQKNVLMQLDLLAHFKWDRPVYFAITTGSEAYIGLEDYFQLEGMAYRLVPYRCYSYDDQPGQVNTDIMYENLMRKFKWGNMNLNNVYLDETNVRMVKSFRNIFGRLATAMVKEGKTKKAAEVCDKCIEVMPDNCIPYDYLMLPVAKAYYASGNNEKADAIVTKLAEYADQELYYYGTFKGADAAYLELERKESINVLKQLYLMTTDFKRESLKKDILGLLNLYYSE